MGGHSRKFYAEQLAALILWVRHDAWLHTAPRPAFDGKPHDPIKPPVARLPADDQRRTPPAIGLYTHLLDYLQEAGTCTWDQGEPLPLPWSDLRAWQQMTKTPLTPWEATALQQLSAAYAHEVSAARDPQYPGPLPRDLEAERLATARQHQAAFRGMIRRP